MLILDVVQEDVALDVRISAEVERIVAAACKDVVQDLWDRTMKV